MNLPAFVFFKRFRTFGHASAHNAERHTTAAEIQTEIRPLTGASGVGRSRASRGIIIHCAKYITVRFEDMKRMKRFAQLHCTILERK